MWIKWNDGGGCDLAPPPQRRRRRCPPPPPPRNLPFVTPQGSKETFHSLHNRFAQSFWIHALLFDSLRHAQCLMPSMAAAAECCCSCRRWTSGSDAEETKRAGDELAAGNQHIGAKMPADPLTHHGLYGLRSSAIPVLTATTGACQWEMAIFDSPQNRQPSTDHQKICHRWLSRRPLQLRQVRPRAILGKWMK